MNIRWVLVCPRTSPARGCPSSGKESTHGFRRSRRNRGRSRSATEPLQQIHRHNDAQRSLFGAHDEAFHPRQRAAIDAYTLSGAEVGPGTSKGLAFTSVFRLSISLWLMDAGVAPMPRICLTPGASNTRMRSRSRKRLNK